ncbi:aminodeoxychorismate synthase component I [Phaeodactylibacter xiamenensis]|jgi:para-aminobenzoate synthetase component 1|uniref:aminodeoxychorismate synthase component I n=1 Tax=Phaeodactylibacter xiamenensis TaxID=1524460 RepID=UPI0024A90029|nr:aminodeoxychorismate synthase component I [Phaeodactylibacter xiamenensis]
MTITTNRQTAQQRMNDLGKDRRPFIFLIDFEMQQPVVLPLDTIDPEQLQFAIHNHRNDQGRPSATDFHFERHPVPIARYAAAFEQVQKALHDGNTYLLNLAFPTAIDTNLSLHDIFLLSQASYRIWLKGQFTCFSPEPFVRISRGGRIASFPMKGTIDATLPGAEQQLLSNDKERAEHATIVDLIRNDLSMVAKKVRVKRYRYVEAITTHTGSLLQTSTEIEGQLPASFHQHLGDLFFKLLPAGSISGAPKQKTVEIIRAAEGQDRGYYTGVCGIYDGQTVDSGVMIRFVEATPDGLVFKSGGGITARSRMEAEYGELLQKAYLPFATAAAPLL